jgi:DNA-binding Xre family transcriptional regulator
MASNSRSLKLSPDGKRQVEHALTDKAWSTEDLADKIGVGRATATKFRAGKQGVDRQNFVNFCKALGLDWATVAEPESPPAPNSGGAEPVEKARSTTAENLQQNLNEAQGVQVQGSETTIAGQTVNVYHGAAQNLATVPNTIDDPKSVQFLVQVGEQSKRYWQNDACDFFQIDNSGHRLRYSYYSNIDPSFDITIISDFNSVNVVYQFGIEVVSVRSEVRNLHHLPLAAEVIQQAQCEIEVPDMTRPYSFKSREVNCLLATHPSKKFILDAERKVLNYEVLLKNYVRNMPNRACIRFWIQSQNSRHFSKPINIASSP